jgi:hypothetical protein
VLRSRKLSVSLCVFVPLRLTSLDAVRSQLRWTRDDDDGSRGGSVREGASQQLAALNPAAAASGVQKASRAGSQTACLIKAGTLLNIWLYFHHGTRVIASARSGKLCVLDYGWTRRLTVPGACMHCQRGSGDTMEACVPHAVLLGCTI